MMAFAFIITRSWRPAAPSDRKTKKTSRKAAAKSSLGSELLYFFGPLVVLGLVFVAAAPIKAAGMRNFDAGTDSVAACVRDLAEVSFAYNGQLAGLSVVPSVLNGASPQPGYRGRLSSFAPNTPPSVGKSVNTTKDTSTI